MHKWWEVIEGDCREVMAGLEPESVDAIVCDPPYGLEFMGKEWDKLDGGLPQENVWKGRRGKGGSTVGTDDSNPGSRHHVSYGNSTRAQFKRCIVCGKRQFSGSPCTCDEPQWVIEHPEGPPSGMVRQQRWHESWAREAFRVLKPGGHLLAFGGTRTFHRLTVAIEDAGFEIRDCLSWLYGQGFPKSLDVSKAIDKTAGAEREVVGSKPTHYPDSDTWGKPNQHVNDKIGTAAYGDYPNTAQDGARPITAPATPEAAQWAGWGTALKPAWEPVIVARKPLIGTVAATVLQHGTGALNIDGCRIGLSEGERAPTGSGDRRGGAIYAQDEWTRNHMANGGNTTPPEGRWPANVALDEAAAELLDAQSGERPTSKPGAVVRRNRHNTGSMAGSLGDPLGIAEVAYGDTGGASRFFYCAKSSRSERNAGLEGMPERVGGSLNASVKGHSLAGKVRSDGAIQNATVTTQSNFHPTVKPIALMRWLVRLVTPPGGLVVDPFNGSGSTGIAAVLEGFRYIGIEQSAEYAEIARRRIAHWEAEHIAELDAAKDTPAQLTLGVA